MGISGDAVWFGDDSCRCDSKVVPEMVLKGADVAPVRGDACTTRTGSLLICSRGCSNLDNTQQQPSEKERRSLVRNVIPCFLSVS